MSFRDRMAARRSSTPPFRVAIVLSGQPRTWRDCLAWWEPMFADIEGVEFDVFAHIWNYNTIGHGQHSAKQPLDPNEMRDLLKFLKPKRFAIEGTEVDPARILRELRRHDDTEPSAGAWQASQFYSVMRAANLKRQYELDMGFEYDVCVKGRMDIVFPEPEHLPSAPPPERHTLYVTHAYHDPDFDRPRTGDIIYYGDSPSFDLAAGFFRHLNRFTIPDYTKDGKMMPPEMPFHDFIRINGMAEIILPWGPGPRLKRPADYTEVLEREGRGLGEHEVF